jgi:hypothetical protein
VRILAPAAGPHHARGGGPAPGICASAAATFSK